MNTNKRLTVLGRTLLAVCISVAMVFGLTTVICSAAPPADATNKTPDAKTEPKAEKKPVKKLTGAELYAVNCNRCHAERYPTEFNPAQWQTLMMHMRVRANLPAKQAKEILKYLQEESGN